MAIFLTILKIIGIVLLIIVGLILFIVLYLLLAPFWFQVEAINDRDFNYKIKIKASTFLHFIQVHARLFKDEELNYDVSMFGTLLKILPREEKPEDDKAKIEGEEKEDFSEVSKQTNVASESIEQVEENSPSESIAEDTGSKNVEASVTKKEAVEIDDIQDIDKSTVKIVDTESDDFEEVFTEDEQTFFKNVRNFFYKYNPKKLANKAKEKIEELKKKSDRIIAVVLDEANKDWLKKVFSELLRFLKSLKLNMKGTDLDFSLGSPDTTGQVSGALALFPPIYHKKVRVIPDFRDDNLYFDGNVFIKGRLHLICVVYFVLVIYFDKQTKQILKLLK